MKKLNNKGLGHHVLIAIVAVVAVVSVAGFFVWQRQKNNNIDAKAAYYTYLSSFPPDSSAGSSNAPKVGWYACKRKVGSDYIVTTLAKYATPNTDVTVGVGYDRTTVFKKKMVNSAVSMPPFRMKGTSLLMVSSETSSSSGMRSNYKLSKIKNC